MSFSNIETTLYSKRGMIISLSLSNEFRGSKAMSSYITRAKQIRLSYKPYAGIVISSKKDYMENIMLPLEDYDNLLSSLKNVYKAIELDDMFVYDQDKRLVLNSALAKEHSHSHISYGKTLMISPDIVTVDGEEYEGAMFTINRKVKLGLTHLELKKLRKLLKRIDISSHAMLAAILGHVTHNDVPMYSSLKINDDSYSKIRPDENKAILSDGMKGRGGRLWEE